MDLGSAIGTNLGEMSGNITKALIEIIDARGIKVDLSTPVKVGGGSQSLTQFLGNSATGAVKTTKEEASSIATAKALREAAAKGLGLNESADLVASTNPLDVGSLLESPGMGSTLTSLSGVTKKKFYVQFNPRELKLTGYGGGLAAKNNYIDSKDKVNTNELTFEKMDVRIELNVQLIFDQVDPQDAFMADKLNMSTTAMIEGAVKAVRTATGSKELCSVQKQVEAFVAALRSPFTRQIIFSWGDMSYSGVLNRVSAQYTMFNVIGAPVRALVNLTLVCADSSVDANNMGPWYEAYSKAFGAGAQSFVKNSQKVGNLFNFNT